jgi:hypothetical protein
MRILTKLIVHEISNQRAGLSVWQLIGLTANRLALLDAHFGQRVLCLCGIWLGINHLSRGDRYNNPPVKKSPNQAMKAW